ncbi:hypothetical protein TNCV_1983331 [Trichonephila clavipes]|nr:hypothetical protein TNCV_1983331 [Trichonephila clavipes]
MPAPGNRSNETRYREKDLATKGKKGRNKENLPLVADFTFSDTRNRKFTNRETVNSQTEHTIIATIKSLGDCSSQSSLKQPHEIILIVNPIEK